MAEDKEMWTFATMEAPFRSEWVNDKVRCNTIHAAALHAGAWMAKVVTNGNDVAVRLVRVLVRVERPKPPFGWNDPMHENYLGEDHVRMISQQMDEFDAS